MGGSFETDERHNETGLRPVRAALRREGLWAEARNLAGELPGWRILSSDEQRLTLVCERGAGLLGGKACVTIRVEGPAGLPSSTLHVRSESAGGILSRDKAIVREFVEPFWRRVC